MQTTRCSVRRYEAWGLDITKLEYRLGKLKALGVRS